MDEVGIFVIEKGVQKKIAAVGLRIIRGVTNHGFALNVCGDLSPFSSFHPCGVANLGVASISALTHNNTLAPDKIAQRLSDEASFV